jgi:hypothetical protein
VDVDTATDGVDVDALADTAASGINTGEAQTQTGWLTWWHDLPVVQWLEGVGVEEYGGTCIYSTANPLGAEHEAFVVDLCDWEAPLLTAGTFLKWLAAFSSALILIGQRRRG